MNKTVLIIEDNQTHYETLKFIFTKYGVGIYPRDENNYKVLAKLLRQFGQVKSDEVLQQIKQNISQYTYDFIILDRSFTDRLDDVSGLILYEKIFEAADVKIPVCLLTNYPNEHNAENYIEKGDYISWEINLYSKVISKLIDHKDEIQNSLKPDIHQNESIIYTTEEIEKLKEKTQLPKSVAILIEKERFKVSPSIAFIVDTVIKYCFYICLAALFIYAPIYLGFSIFKYYEDPIQIAEHTFIVFLPFLITCGFYIFYLKSLSPYVKQKPIDKDDFESASNLMNLTKKLFISSLLSYLFIKLIELLFLEGDMPKPPPFDTAYKTNSPIVLLYFIGACIAILLLYYIYMDRSHHYGAGYGEHQNKT